MFYRSAAQGSKTFGGWIAVKAGIRKLLVSLSTLALAGCLGVSAACTTPAAMTQTQTGGASSEKIIDVTDTLGDQLNTMQNLNEDLLTSAAAQAKTKSDGTRRIIVEMNSDSMLDVYLGSSSVQRRYEDFTAYVNGTEGSSYAASLAREQSGFLASLKNSSISYELRHSYTSVVNGVSLVVKDEDVSAIASLSCVKNIIYSEVYAVPQATVTENVVNVYDTGIYDSSEIEYQGDGMLIAVLDTGYDRNHSAFREMPPEGSEKLTKEVVEANMDNLAASTQGSAITVDDVYYNAKVPFAYDYADNDPDVFPKTSSHGHHVAGIIAGKDENVTAEDGEAFENGETFIGVAPNAQLMICKVFPDLEDGTEGGAETDDILAAVSDCITLGTDVINMSLGVSAGFSREIDETAVNEVYDKVYEAGINLVVAASNSGSSAQNGAYGTTNLTSNPDSGTVGSPSTYAGALSVASISGQKSSYMELSDGTAVYFNESSNAAGEQGDFVEELLGDNQDGTFNFVVVPGYGRANNYTTAVRRALAQGNCIAVVSRGETNFEEKQRIAYENGAVGCIIYNNQSGRIIASLGTGKEIPTCTVTADIGSALVALGSGTIYLNKDYEAGPFMSDFSSWGPTPDLKIKPEITAHGGEITSSVVGGYSIYSGTSMASPNMAGAVALLRQHVEETTDLTGIELADRVNSLLMSTATIVNDERGLPYSVRRQGAGLGDISKAIATESYLYVENNAKPKMELGDDPDREGIYTMEFHVVNTSSEAKNYTLDAIVMTESVSIDNITVSEQSYMLDRAEKEFYVNGEYSANGEVTLGAGEDATITVTVSLTSDEKAYLDANFENGMYVEGFITLTDADASGVDLSIPYLAFYGDWLDAPIFDATTYEVSADANNSAIQDEDKTVAAVYESVVIGRYYEGSETYLPLGQYVYDLAEGEESGITASTDKVAIGKSQYGVYEFYAVYFGLLRAVQYLDVTIENTVTGEVVWQKTLNNVNKSYSTSPGYAEIGLRPADYGLLNNTQYTATFTARNYYNGRSTEDQTETFTFYVDYEAPIMYDSAIRYEYDSTDMTRVRNAYLDLYLYDNHYVQAVQLFSYQEAESDVDWATEETGAVDWLTEYSIPVDSSRGAVNRVTVEITDWLDQFMTVEGQTGKYIGVRVDDYALNSGVYLVQLTTPEVNKVDVVASYVDGTGSRVENSIGGQTILMNAGSALNLTDDTGRVEMDGTEAVATFEVELFNYATYSCSHIDAHGVQCDFVYDEHNGLTYATGDYYYDPSTGTVRQVTADDLPEGYPAGTLFADVIAQRSGSGYTSRHFVCPACGTEVTFTYNSRNETLSPDNFTKTSADPMIHDVLWESGNEAVVRVNNGRLYAVGEGEATISAYAPGAADYPYPSDADGSQAFTFVVRVTGTAGTAQLDAISVGSYDNLTTGVSRMVNGNSISVENGSELVLYPSFEPWYVDSIPNLTWTPSDSRLLEVVESDSSHARVICKQEGVVELYLNANGVLATFYITIGEEYTVYSMYCYDYNGPGYTDTYVDEDGDKRNILVIPADLGITNMGYMVATREGPFYENQNIDTVIIPEGVTTLGLSCFENSSLRRIFLPTSLIAISYNAFRGCDQLEEVVWYDASEDNEYGLSYDADNNSYMVDGVTVSGTEAADRVTWDAFFERTSEECTSQSLVVGSDAFRDCVRLTTFDFSRVTGIYDNAFYNTVSLSEADLGNLRFGNARAFYGSGIENVTLSAITQLNTDFFSGTAIEHVDYYASTVAAAAFRGMTELRSITFHNSVDAIGSNAFAGSTALSSVTFADGATCSSIGDSAFAGCTSLTNFDLPEGVVSIGNNAFDGCSALESVTLDGGDRLTSLGNDIFADCASLKSISLRGISNYYAEESTIDAGETYVMLVTVGGNEPVLAPPAYPVAGSSNTVTIGEGVTTIYANAYANNASLAGKTLIIAEGVERIEARAFRGTGIVRVVLPASLRYLGESAFANCGSLESVVFQSDLDSISADLFYGCGSLSEVQIPDSVTSIGARAFMGTAIGSVIIGSNVRTIGESAFMNCEQLVSLTFAQNANLAEIGAYAFYGSYLSELVLPDSVTALGAMAFANCPLLADVTISASLENMGERVFLNDTRLMRVEFREGASVIGDYAFVALDGTQLMPMPYLAEVIIPASVKAIGSYAFAGNTALTSIDLSGVVYIDSHAFYQTTSLTDVTLDEATSYIGVSAFEESAVENIDLSGVEYFDARSFYGTAIGNTDFTDALEIGDDAFYNCLNISGTVRLPNVVQIYSGAFYVPTSSETGATVTGNITAVELGDSLVGLGGGAFFNSRIRSIHLPASLEIIGSPAFAGCTSLVQISVDEANETFFVDESYGGLYRYLDNGTYELVAVPNGLQMREVGENMRPYVILDGTSRVGDFAMAYCRNIHAVEIPASVRSIGPSAFFYMGIGLIADSIGTVSREYYPKYIFKGLQAPAVEASTNVDDIVTIVDLYDNFSYMIGYQMADMVIPVNATGYESVIYEFFFYDQEYSAEVIESGTQALLDWLIALDVDALTLEDEAEVTQMNTNYNMLTDGQRAFLAEYADKLQSAVDRIAELRGDTPGPDNPPDNPPDDPPETQPVTAGNLGLIIGLSVAGVVVVVAVVIAVFLMLRHRKGNVSADDSPEAGGQTQEGTEQDASGEDKKEE